jgi:hypothetical protein
MKTITIAISLLALCAFCGIASAGQFGTTEPTASPGKFSLGLGYFNENMSWQSTVYNNFRTTSNQGFVQVSYGIAKPLEVYGRIGGANMKMKDFSPYISDNAKPFGTLGLKYQFYKGTIFGFGAFAQGSYYSYFNDSAMAPGITTSGTIVPNAIYDYKIKNYYNLNAGLSAQAKFKSFIVYGGGFLYRSRAKVESTTSGIIGTTFRTSYFNDNIKERNNLGAFLGVKIPITKQLGLNLELQQREYSSCGAILSYSF